MSNTVAQDGDSIARYIKTDSSGHPILGAGSSQIGTVNEARGKTILYDYDSAVNTTTILRTVTAGKTYYLLQLGVTYQASVNDLQGRIEVGAAGGRIFEFRSHITATYYERDSNAWTITYPHPIPVAAGVVIQIVSSGAGMKTEAWIVGWEE